MGRNKKPVLVYLDYNVIVSLHEGDITVEQIKNAVGTNNVVFPFSASHIEEVKNIKDSNGIQKDTLIHNRLQFIDSITKRQYLERLGFDLPYKKRSVNAFDVYETLTEVPWVDSAYRLFNNFITEEQKQYYRETLQLDSRTLNNIRPEQIIQHLNTKFTQFHNMSILDMITHSRTYFPATYKWGIETDITSLFALLDVIGYWKDKFSSNSNVARFWDSSHCGIASFCNFLVSQDERMRLKSEVAYSVYNVQTRIIRI